MRRSALDTPWRVARRGARRLMRRAPGRLGVLAYHRVALSEIDPWSLSVTPDHFDEQVAVLREVGHVDRLDDALAVSPLARCRRRQPTFAITFDDGYVDNLVDAVPLLERHDVPATFFIPTGLLDGSSFWWDVLSEIVLGSSVSSAQLADAAISLGLLEGSSRDDVVDNASAHRLLYQALVTRPRAEIDESLFDLCGHVGIGLPTPTGRPMTAEELHRVADHPLVTIGIHTVNHRRLPLLSVGEIRAEIGDGARRLDELLGVRRRLLAYPYGAASSSVAAIVRALDIPYAVTTAGRWVALREDPMLVPRLHPPNVGGGDFTSWIARS